MALFSRRPKKSDDPAADEARQQATADTPGETPEDATASSDPSAGGTPDASGTASQGSESVPHVSISVSTYGKPGSGAPAGVTGPDVPADRVDATAPAAGAVSGAAPAGTAAPSGTAPARPAHLASPAAEASTRVETVPGLRDNVLLRDALAALPAQAQPTELINIARQLLQGHVFIRVQGDARELLAQGKRLPTSMVTYKDEKYMLVYSSGKALQDAVRADGDTGTSALAQSVGGLLRQVVDGPMGGIAVDHASRPGSAILPKQLIARALSDLDPELRVKTLLAAPRTPEIAGRIAESLTVAPLWIAARRTDEGKVGIAELRTTDGTRLLELFSHPLELLALGRGDQPVKVEPAQLAKALRGDTGLSGVVVDPAGPWIRLTRNQLHPLLIVGT